MSDRPTADIIARAKFLVGLHNQSQGGPYEGFAAEQFVMCLKEAADRLAELDAIVQAVIAHGSEHSPVNDDIRSFCNYLINGRTP